MKFQGIYVAAATPFDHTGAIYRAKVQHNFEKWRRTSVAGFVVGGLAGEGPLLDFEDKGELFRLASACIPSDRMFIADVSAEGVHEAARLARMAASAGAKAVVSLPPHEYKSVMYGPEAQTLFFRALADRSPVPVLTHNAPLITGVDLLAETAAKLSEHPNIVGMIEAGPHASRIVQIREHLSVERGSKAFAILSGADTQVWDALKAGANGAVLPFASAAPYAAIAIWEAFRTREEEAGIDWQTRISHPSILVTDMYGAPGLKHAMDLNGYYGGPPRLPFTILDERAKSEIEEAFRDLKG